MITLEELKPILQAAARAPSGDNVQPWRVEVSPEEGIVWLFNRPERDPSYFNYRQLASMVSLGAFSENFRLEAEARGWTVEIEPFPQPREENCVARFSLRAGPAVESPLRDAISGRSTQRTFFKGGRLDAETGTRLRAAADKLPARVVLLEGKSKDKAAARLGANDRLVFEHPEIHDFLFRQIRWSEAEAASSGTGMPVGTLGLNPAERLMFPLLGRWRWVRWLNRAGLSRIIGMKGRMLCQSATGLGFVLIRQPADEQAFFHAGRVFERLWLQCTAEGLAFQPVTGFTFLLARLRDGSLPGFSAGQVALLRWLERDLRALCEADDDEIIALGCRMGRARPSAARTPRLEVDVALRKQE